MSISSQNSVSGIRPVNAVPSFPKRNEPREATFGAGVPSDKAVPTAPAAQDGHARLEAFSERIENRFQHALKSQDLSPRQAAALQEERDRFQSLLGRFEAAYLDGAEGPKANAAEGIDRLLQHFSQSVNHILTGGAAKDTPTDPVRPNTTARGSSRDGIDLIG